MFEEFKARATAVGAEVHRFASNREALAFIREFMCREGVAELPGSYAVWADSPMLAALAPEERPALPGLGFEVTRLTAAEAKIGISQADWALADTGSLVQDQSAVEQRLVSSLPSIHVALVPTGGILPDKPTLFTRINPATSRYIAFITGPSRTADIERVLTIGVHGPERLVIVFVDELGGRQA